MHQKDNKLMEMLWIFSNTCMDVKDQKHNLENNPVSQYIRQTNKGLWDSLLEAKLFS